MIVSYSIFKILKEEFEFDLNSFRYFAGHSLGEYSALVCSGHWILMMLYIYYTKEVSLCKKQCL